MKNLRRKNKNQTKAKTNHRKKRKKVANQRLNRNPKGRKANIVGPHGDICTSSKFILIIITLTFAKDVVYV